MLPRSLLVATVALLSLAVGCSRDEGSTSAPVTATLAAPAERGGSTSRAPGTAGASPDLPLPGPTVGSAPGGPVPTVADPAPARPCGAPEVLCVDASVAAATPDGSASNPFASVRDAVAAAGGRTTIQIASGRYEEALLLRGVAGLRLVGGFAAGGDFSRRDPASTPEIVGNGTTAVIELVESSDVHIEGLRLTGGGGHSDGSNWSGGAIYLDGTSSKVTVVGNRLDRNDVAHGDDPTAAVGGAIASSGSDVTIRSNLIEGNRSGRGAVAVSGTTTIEGNTVRDNVAVGDHGGGIYASGTVTVAGNHIEGNRVGTEYSWGGGIIVYGDGTTATLRGNRVTGNRAVTAGSGVFVDDGADATLVGELYDANECAAQGGAGVLVDSGGETETVAELVNVTVVGHECPGSELGGDGLFVSVSEPDDPRPQVSVRSSIFWANAGRDVLGFETSVSVSDSLAEQQLDGTGNQRADPLFLDPARGDYRVRPGSPSIDAGDPAAAFSSEPEPNGQRINLGHTGNTAQATPSSPP